jgi:hypothetical protein
MDTIAQHHTDHANTLDLGTNGGTNDATHTVHYHMGDLSKYTSVETKDTRANHLLLVSKKETNRYGTPLATDSRSLRSQSALVPLYRADLHVQKSYQAILLKQVDRCNQETTRDTARASAQDMRIETSMDSIRKFVAQYSKYPPCLQMNHEHFLIQPIKFFQKINQAIH